MTSELSTGFTAAADLLFVVADQVFGLVCHQEAERLVHIGDYTLRLCPRCIGMHGGFFAAVIFIGRLITCGKGCERQDVWLIPLAAVLCTLTGLEWLLEFERVLVPDPALRLWTGAASGVGGGTLFLVYRRRRRFTGLSLPTAPATAVSLAGVLLLVVLLPDGQPYIVTASLLTAVLCNVAMVGRTLLHLLLRRV